MKERNKERSQQSWEFKREKRQVNKRETSVNTRGKFIIVRGITTFKKPRDEKLMEQSENCWIIDRARGKEENEEKRLRSRKEGNAFPLSQCQTWLIKIYVCGQAQKTIKRTTLCQQAEGTRHKAAGPASTDSGKDWKVKATTDKSIVWPHEAAAAVRRQGQQQW